MRRAVDSLRTLPSLADRFASRRRVLAAFVTRANACPHGRVRYAKPGASAPPAVFRRWNTPKKTLRRSNLQSLDAPDFFFLTAIWHKRCSR